MIRIYMLWDHDEYGPENYAFTTDPQKLVPLYDQLWRRDALWVANGRAKLEEMVKRGECESCPLSTGWGGPHLTVAATDVIYGEEWRKAEQAAFRGRIGWKEPK